VERRAFLIVGSAAGEPDAAHNEATGGPVPDTETAALPGLNPVGPLFCVWTGVMFWPVARFMYGASR
jgi:hypothetical protein